MEIINKKLNELTLIELYEIIKLRMDVFIYEQKILSVDELDDDDFNANHIFIKDGKNICSYIRVIAGEDVHKLGRVCTKKSARLKGYSRKLIEYAMSKYEKILVSAQVQALPFYLKIGFKKIGKTYILANIIHQDVIYENK